MGDNDQVRRDKGDDAMAQRTRRIRELNDRLRRTGMGGVVTITAGIAVLSDLEVSRIMLAVASFEAFNSDNDPYGEHDFAVMEVEGRRLIWKIDYYDRSRQWGAEDPADPAETCRVLTVMLSSEY